MTPTISTPRLILRQLTKATGRNVGWLRDQDVMRYSQQQHGNHSLSSQLRYIQSFGGYSHLWAITIAETGDHIGNISARNDLPNNVADVGILIGDMECWGKGYGKEAWKAVCGWLLDKDGGHVRKLEAGCAKTNEAMMKIIQGTGFKLEGERLNKFILRGQLVSAVLFGRI